MDLCLGPGAGRAGGKWAPARRERGAGTEGGGGGAGPREDGGKTAAPFGVCFQSWHQEGDIFTAGPSFSSPFPISTPQPPASVFPFLRRGGGVELGRPHPRSPHCRGESDAGSAAAVNLVLSLRSLRGSVDKPRLW